MLQNLDWKRELSADPLKRYEQLRNDPWLFLKYCVYTHDEVDQENPIKRYPSHLDYLMYLTLAWQKRKKLAIPKSRRLTVSWTFISLALWQCIFYKYRSWAFVSKKELDSAELVQRAEFIYNHIPEDILPKDLLPKLKRGRMQTVPPILEFEDIGSKIMGFPSGGNQLRQRGFSGILEDECAFWDDAEAAYASAEPTVKGGGRLIMVSTRFPGFFKKIVYDQLDSKDLNFTAIPPVPTEAPMEGIDTWTNPRNEFFVIDLSHRANPAKRDPAFEEGLRRTLPIHLYRQEYGKSWDTFSGKPVYEDFNENIHVVQQEPKLYQGLPLLIGWDSSGLTPAAVLGQLQEDRLVIMKEIIGVGMGANRFIPHVIHELRQTWPQITDLEKQTMSFFDPDGFKRNHITEETYIQALHSHGFTEITPGPVSWNKRVEAVNQFLVGLVKGKPKFQIYERACPVLTAGLKGGFRYPDKMLEVEADKPRPVKDIHCVDAETEILTLDGWFKHGQLLVGQPIYEYDLTKNCLIEGELLNVHRFKENSKVIRFANQKHEFYLTPEHRCVVKSRWRETPHIELAKNLTETHRFFHPEAKKEAQKKKQLSDSIVELAAWVMTEGSMRNSGAYILLQSIDHNPHHVHHIDKLISNYHDCFRKKDRIGGINNSRFACWHIRGDAQFMLNTLIPTKTKTPTPEFINKMNNTQRRLFIYTSMCGDGDCANKLTPGLKFSRNQDLFDALPVARIKLKNKEQIDALHMMATLCGIRARVTTSDKEYWSLTLNKTQKYVTIAGLSQEEGTLPFVWCPQTKSGTWIMRRNGQVYVTGNSHPNDALQYLCGGIIDTVDSRYNNFEIPTPQYGFQKETTGRKKTKDPYGRKQR